MKKFLMTISFMVFTITVMAVPAKRGVWKTLKLADGTELRAQLVGDEHGNYWKGDDGKGYRQAADADYFVVIDKNVITAKANARRNMLNTNRLYSC